MATSDAQEPPAKPTIAILTAKPLEKQAIENLVAVKGERYSDDIDGGRHYIRGSLPGESGDHQIVVPPESKGQDDAAGTVGNLVTLYPSIRLFIFVGIAGGVRDRVHRGDVVVSEHIIDSDPRRIERGKERSRLICPEPDPRALESLNPYLRPGQAAAQQWEAVWKELCSSPSVRKSFPEWAHKIKETNAHPRVHKDTIASGDAIVNDDEIRAKWAEHYEFGAFETEGAAVAKEAHAYERGYLVVRGISDFGEGDLSDAASEFFRSFSVHVAASCLGGLLSGLRVYPDTIDAERPAKMAGQSRQPSGLATKVDPKRKGESPTKPRRVGLRGYVATFVEAHMTGPQISLPGAGRSLPAVWGGRLLFGQPAGKGGFDVAYVQRSRGSIKFELDRQEDIRERYRVILELTRNEAEREKSDQPKICVIGAKYPLEDRPAILELEWTNVLHSEVVALTRLLRPTPKRVPDTVAIQKLLHGRFDPGPNSPNGLCVDCVVLTTSFAQGTSRTTAPGLVLGLRSSQVQPDYFPQTWMASATENPKVFNELTGLVAEDPIETARRGLEEELGFRPDKERVHLAGFLLEEVTLSYHLVAIVESGLTFDQIRRRWEDAPDAEIDALLEVAIEPAAVLNECAATGIVPASVWASASHTDPPPSKELERQLHPTAGVGILAAQWWVASKGN